MPNRIKFTFFSIQCEAFTIGMSFENFLKTMIVSSQNGLKSVYKENALVYLKQ